MQYYFGDAASAFGQVRLYEKTRVRRNTDGPGGFYAKWAANMPESIEATGEDAIFGQITFACRQILPNLFDSLRFRLKRGNLPGAR